MLMQRDRLVGFVIGQPAEADFEAIVGLPTPRSEIEPRTLFYTADAQF